MDTSRHTVALSCGKSECNLPLLPDGYCAKWYTVVRQNRIRHLNLPSSGMLRGAGEVESPLHSGIRETTPSGTCARIWAVTLRPGCNKQKGAGFSSCPALQVRIYSGLRKAHNGSSFPYRCLSLCFVMAGNLSRCGRGCERTAFFARRAGEWVQARLQ
jgi:hypothetical protein